MYPLYKFDQNHSILFVNGIKVVTSNQNVIDVQLKFNA